MSDKRDEKVTSTTARPSVRSSSHKPQETKGDDGDGNAAAIAAGITVPVIILLLVAGIAYWFYRKKYPVRMIMGRDFATFYNPEYSQNKSQHTLVREDADTFFQQTQPTGMVTLVLGENDEEARVSYTNAGFQYDTQDADEEEVEKRFRQQKAYLFKKDEDQDEVDHGERRQDEEDGDGDGAGSKKKKAKSKANGELQRDTGHDNAAFSGDSEGEGKEESHGKETGDTSAKKDGADTGSVSSDASKDKAAAPESGSGQDTSPSSSSAPMGSDLNISREGMTVRDFLLLAKEKRAHSDVQRERAGSLTPFEFDISKSARRRAQSAGDIWASALQAAPPLSREELALDSADLTGSEHVEQQADSSAVHGTYENLADVAEGGKSVEDVGDTASPDRDVDVKVEEEEEEEEKNKMLKSSMEDSYVIVDETASGSNESIPHTTDGTEYSERNRTSSSTSDSSYEKVTSSLINGNLQSSSHDIHGGDPDSSRQEEEEAGSKQETATPTTSSPESVPRQEEEDVPERDKTMQSSLKPGMMGSFESLGSSRENAEKPAGVTVHLEDETIPGSHVSAPHSAPTPDSVDLTAAVGDQSNTVSVKPREERPAPVPSPSPDPAEAEEVSPSSSLVMLDRGDVEEDPDIQDNDSAEDEGYDNLHLEQQGVPSLGVSGPQPPAGVSLQTQPGLHVLRSLSFSDRSSLSSNTSDDPREKLPDISHQQDLQQQGVTAALTDNTAFKDTGEFSPSRQTVPAQHPSSSSSHTDHPSQPAAAAAGRNPAPSPLPEPPHPPLPTSPIPGLPTLSSPHPGHVRSSESEVEDEEELTEEDIRQALESSSDDSSEELLHQHQQPPEVGHSAAAPVKIQLTDKFVFSEDDDEDDDVEC